MAARDNTPSQPRLSPPDLPSILREVGSPERGADLQAVRIVASSGDVEAPHASIVDSVWEAPTLDRLEVTGAVFADVRIGDARIAACTARESRWRDCSLEGGRIGSLDLSRAELDGVELRGLRIDYLALAAAQLSHVRFVDCTFGAIDFPDARLNRVAFEQCRVNEIDTRGMKGVDVDLRGLDVLAFTDVSSLRGVTLSPHQVEAHSAAFAASLGVHVID